ncbi:MAG: hypothetical protein HUU57_03185 [Bdellovibrio sp.]|nr:hypothetical protein [Bdellovibrio sp.]
MIKKLLVFSFLLSSLVAFQNCSSGFDALSSLSLDGKNDLISLTSSLEGSAVAGEQDFQVLTDSFHANDKGQLGAGQPAEFNFYNAVPDFFAGKNNMLLNDFIKQVSDLRSSHFLSASVAYPGCLDKAGSAVTVYTYSKPYQVYQKDFLQWTQNRIGANDFLPPKARSKNELKDNKKCPAFPRAPTQEAELKNTQGQAIYRDSDKSLVLAMDNRYNPYRWMAPVNEVHHIEAPSLAVTVRSSAQQIAESEILLSQALSGTPEKDLVLNYDIELEVDDFSASMNEKSFNDILEGSQGKDFFSVFLQDIQSFITDSRVGGGHKLTVQKYLNTRVLPQTFQMSLMVNWKESDGVYRLSEFMLASQNYKSSLLDDYQVTPQSALNPYILEGGNGGNVGWHRMNVDGLKLFKDSYPELYPLSEGAAHTEIITSSYKQRIKGTLNLSKYYKLARGLQFFPGQKGAWGNSWIGFDGDVPSFKNSSERHGIHWVGAIFEAHGPYKVKLKIKDLKVGRQDVVRTPAQVTPETPSTQAPDQTSDPVTVKKPASCVMFGKTVAHGDYVNVFKSSSVPYDATCESVKRYCNDGTLSGTGGYATCTKQSAPEILPNKEAPIGSFDSLSLANGTLLAEGWAYDADVPSRGLTIHFYAHAPYGQGGALLAVTTANLPRSDLNSAGYIGNHGFSFALPAYLNGVKVQKVFAYAIDPATNGGHLLSQNPKSSP